MATPEQVYVDIDLHQNQLLNSAIQKVDIFPTNPVKSQICYLTSDFGKYSGNLIYYFNGFDWISLNSKLIIETLGDVSSIASSTNTTISLTQTVTGIQGKPITLATGFLKYNGSSWVFETISAGGTVTSVGLSVPSLFTVSGSPITTSGTLGFTWNGSNSNFVLADGSVVARNTYLTTALAATTYQPLATNLTTFSSLGNPSSNGYVLSSTTAGVMSWIPVVGGGGTVTSIALSAPSIFTVSGSPITTNGTLSFVWNGSSSNLVKADGSTIAASSYQNANSNLTTISGYSSLTNLTSLVGLSNPLSTAHLQITSGGIMSWDTTTYLSTAPTITLSGDVTGSGTGAFPTTVVRINGASIPNSATLIGTNSSSQLISLSTLPTSAEPAHTGDVTNTAGSLNLIITSGSVTLAKMANLPANTIIGNNTGSSTIPIALTVSQVKTLLAISATDVSGISATVPITYSSGVIAHQSTDGYLHVPATGTTNNGKVLTAGSTAGSLSWTTLTTGTITGTGSAGMIPKWSSTTGLTNSSISDSGSLVTISNPLTVTGVTTLATTLSGVLLASSGVISNVINNSSSYFVLGDGSTVVTSTYATSTSLGNYLPLVAGISYPLTGILYANSITSATGAIVAGKAALGTWNDGTNNYAWFGATGQNQQTSGNSGFIQVATGTSTGTIYIAAPSTKLIYNQINSSNITVISSTGMDITGGLSISNLNVAGMVINNAAGVLSTSPVATVMANYLLSSTAASTYLTIANAASTYQPLNAKLTSISSLANASGALTNNGSGTFSYVSYLTGNQTITLSGDVTGSGPTAITTSISAATVTSKALTGYSASTNTAIVATDTILAAFGKTQAQINARVSSVALSTPSIFTVSGSPITGSGTLSFAWNGLNLNFVLADGTTVATSTYLTVANASATYLPLSGGTLTGQLNLNPDNINNFIKFINTNNMLIRGNSGGTYAAINCTSSGAFGVAPTVNIGPEPGNGNGVTTANLNITGNLTTSGTIKFPGVNSGTAGIVYIATDGTLSRSTSGSDLPGGPYLPLNAGSSYPLSGDLYLSDPGIGNSRWIQATVGTNDIFRYGGGSTGSNAGYAEIATADDGNEPIYVRQYTGIFTTLTRTLTLLDGSGNTLVPGNLTANSFIKSGGTSSQFLKADGSVDSNNYVKLDGSFNYSSSGWGGAAPAWVKVGTISITSQYGSAAGRIKFMFQGGNGGTSTYNSHSGILCFRAKQQNVMTSSLDTCTLWWESASTMGIPSYFFGVKTSDTSSLKSVDLYIRCDESYEGITYVFEDISTANGSFTPIGGNWTTTTPSPISYTGIGTINHDISAQATNILGGLTVGTNAVIGGTISYNGGILQQLNNSGTPITTYGSIYGKNAPQTLAGHSVTWYIDGSELNLNASSSGFLGGNVFIRIDNNSLMQVNSSTIACSVGITATAMSNQIQALNTITPANNVLINAPNIICTTASNTTTITPTSITFSGTVGSGSYTASVATTGTIKLGVQRISSTTAIGNLSAFWVFPAFNGDLYLPGSPSDGCAFGISMSTPTYSFSNIQGNGHNIYYGYTTSNSSSIGNTSGNYPPHLIFVVYDQTSGCWYASTTHN